MEVVGISKRVTHKYRDGWAHEDRWQYLGHLLVTPAKVTEEGNRYDEGDTYVRFARISNISRKAFKELKRGIQDTMGGSRCHHEYDCCGCASYHVQVERVRPRLVLIRTRVRYNY